MTTQLTIVLVVLIICITILIFTAMVKVNQTKWDKALDELEKAVQRVKWTEVNTNDMRRFMDTGNDTLADMRAGIQAYMEYLNKLEKKSK